MSATMTWKTADPEARFSTALQRLTAIAPDYDGPACIGLAVSGGPDSLAMLLMAHQTCPNAISVATVDHGLRPESRAEADMVGRLCAELGRAHSVLTPETPIRGSIQSAAREVRYGLLRSWADVNGLDWIATAHHADDQIETLLMRIARGSGLAGLASIREQSQRIIRPLLGFTKAELLAYCEARGVATCFDPSNANPAFDRVQVRQWLESAPPLIDSRRAVRTVNALAEAHSALEWAADQIEETRIAKGAKGEIALNPEGLPAELLRRLLIRALNRLDPHLQPRGEVTDRLLDALPQGKRLTVGNILCTGGASWRFEWAPKRRENHQ